MGAMPRPFVVYDAPREKPRAGSSRTNKSLRAKIGRRYGWTCHLCGQPISRDLDPNGRDPMRPSLDHLIPRSKGGTRRQANLRLAHWICNQERGGAPLRC